MRGPTPIVVCGSARSGTTLLLRLLDGHPELVVFPTETQLYQILANRRLSRWIRHFAELTGRYDLMELLAWRPLRPFTFSGRQALAGRMEVWASEYPHGHSNSARVIAELVEATSGPERYWSAFLTLFTRLSNLDLSDKRYWVEKTPMNERYAAMIDRWAEGRCRFLHTVRDPRDVVASSLPMIDARTKARWGREHRLVHVCYQWSCSVEWRRHNARRFGTRHHLLRYEDLVRSTRNVMEEVCGFLDIEAHRGLTTPTRFGSSISANSSYQDFTAADAVRQSQIHRHRQVMSAEEISHVEALLGGQMRALGYEPGTPHDRPQAPPRISTGNPTADRKSAIQSWQMARTQRRYTAGVSGGLTTTGEDACERERSAVVSRPTERQ